MNNKYIGLDNLATMKKIAELIDKSGLNDKEISEYLGLTVQSVNKWRHGKGIPDLENLFLLSRLFGIRVDDFLVARMDDGNINKKELSAKETAIAAFCKKARIIDFSGFMYQELPA